MPSSRNSYPELHEQMYEPTEFLHTPFTESQDDVLTDAFVNI